ncbi:MAG: hypothetical protein KJO97_05980 [Acidimicrobiia bacterium]|nr:hypothetical protein [Acidimicrobiia bacterium]
MASSPLPSRTDASRPRPETGRHLFWLAVATVVAIRIGWSVASWDPGFSALFADDFDRVRLALLWEQDPYFLPPGPLLWVPLQSWVLGLTFLASGSLFSSNPMALAAIVNTGAVMGTGALAGWSAWLLFRSRWAALAAASVLVFSPWALVLSVSGLSEPLYFVAVAATVAAFVSWTASGTTASLYAGSVAALLATTGRYEGWWLAAAWCLLTALTLWRRGKLTGWRLPALALPGIFPSIWLIAGQVRHDDPLYFSSIVSGTADRVALGPVATYYPSALAQAAPAILILSLVAVWMFRSHSLIRALAGLAGLHFALFYAGSLVTNGRGLVPERFMFAFAVALAPLIGGIVVLVRQRVPASAIRAGTFATLALAVGIVFVIRVGNNPQVEEWSPPEDLIGAARWIGDSYSGDSIALSTPPGQIQLFTSLLGDRVVAVPERSDSDVHTERAAIQDLTAGSSVGSWEVTGIGTEASPPPPCENCDDWYFTTEAGETIPLPASPFLPLRFGDNNPPAGAKATIWRTIDTSGSDVSGRVELRAINGHGVLTGRIRVQVAVDGAVIFDDDAGSENRWYAPSFDLPQGSGDSTIEVSLIAQPGIEQGWGWGRTLVLVRALTLEE